MNRHKSLHVRHFTVALLTALLGFPAQAQPAANTSALTIPVLQNSEKNKALLKLSPITIPYIVQLSVQQKASTVGKQPLTVEMQTNLGFRFEALAAEAGTPGIITVRITVVNGRFSRKGTDGVVIEYDSANPPEKVPDAAETIALLQGLSFDTEFDTTGRLQQVRNIEQIVEQMLERLDIKSDQRDYVREAVKEALDDTAFKNFGNILASFSDKPVGVGDQWHKVDPVSIDHSLIYDTTCTLTDRRDSKATISVKSDTRPDPKRKNPQPVYQPQGTQSGFFEVDEATGQTLRSELRQFLTGHMDAMGQFAPKGKTTSKFFLNSIFTVETSKIAQP